MTARRAGPLRVGLVGCGRWGRHILRDLLALDAQVTVADPDPGARADAQGFEVEAVSDLAALPPALDGLVVATPASTHAAVIEALLPRGIPIFVEKPLANQPAAARRLAEAGQGRLFVMEKWRWHPGVIFLASLARDRTLGPVEALTCLRLQTDCPIADVDPIWTLLPHDLSIATEILGRIPTAVAATAEYRDDRPTGLKGDLGTAAPLLHVEVSAAREAYHRLVLLTCRNGTAFWSSDADDVVFLHRRRDENRQLPLERHAVVGEPPLLAELRTFLAHLAGGPPPKATAADGAATVEAVAALRHLAGLDAEA
ncbi:MAG: Gfo/Idh/MocA family protein [Pseudomonadota bacterium]